MEINYTEKQIKDALWRKGELSWKLDADQKKDVDAFYADDKRFRVWLLSRRRGKSYTLTVLALEQCIRQKRSIVTYVAPTKSQLREYLHSLMLTLIDDCPSDIRPEFNTQRLAWVFPNGSIIMLNGTDNNHAEKIRGRDSHLVLIDEAKDCSKLDYVYKSILRPTTLLTKGKIVMAGSAPEDEENDYAKFIEKAEIDEVLTVRTIHGHPRMTPEEIEEEIKENGGWDSDHVKREYLCMICKNENISVIPEYDEELEKKIVKEWAKPAHYDSYVSMDLGSKDLTFLVFGYYDFKHAKIIIEDELVMRGNEKDFLPRLIKGIKNIEEKLWFDYKSYSKLGPTLRVSDINPLFTDEIYRASNGDIYFGQPKKDDKDSAINMLRQFLAAGKIIINPKCVNLRRHLKNAKWFSERNKKDFARSQDDGHYDGVDALLYFIRSVQYNKNPYPAGYDLNPNNLFVKDKKVFEQDNSQINAFRKIFNIKRKR